ncbi:M20 metallopeptidase family protein [Fuchsiella alkaliacetigena]|uniref:M20 metallopeptidase family protein n=1 Tax=Fuchsiella alkaliacetigena TaxID=957042 RepID=UPI002009DE42|nr:M20 family metallopeptidase [Fuchsiella alkaliacetigena]MCK8825130.1 M20 family metallopeptidase [Fuchsiella alkaliacetigena]
MLRERILKLAKKFEAEIIEIQRSIHQNPELAFAEENTAKLVIDKLKELGLELETGLAKTGVCALQKNKGGAGKTILLRADMDALPIQEETGLDYASQNSGVMHACGHDAHVAMLLGAAMVLNELQAELKGNIKFLFQPAEEQEGGAAKMIEADVLKEPEVDAALGLHVWGAIPKGVVQCRAGPVMAASDRFFIRIHGKGGHAAQPHNCVDPIPIAAEVITALQNIVSRQTDPLEPLVISVCHLEAGETHNIIPSQVLLEGTVRTLSSQLREKTPQLMEDTIAGTVKTQRADYDFDYLRYFPPVVNDSQMTELLKEAAKKVLAEDKVEKFQKPIMAGEDFAYFAQAVPAVLFFLGIAPSAEEQITHHHPEFVVDEAVLKDGVAVLAQTAVDFLQN